MTLFLFKAGTENFFIYLSLELYNKPLNFFQVSTEGGGKAHFTMLYSQLSVLVFLGYLQTICLLTWREKRRYLPYAIKVPEK